MKHSIARSLALTAPLFVIVALAGCGKEKAPQQAAAAGEILPRSASDDMLPYDTLQSQPSLAVPDDSETGRPASVRRGAARGPEEDEEPVVDEQPAAETPPEAPAGAE